MNFWLLIFFGALAITFALITFIAYKLWRVHLMLYAVRDAQWHEQRRATHLYRQLECLIGLYKELKLEKALPGTRGWAASPDFLLELARHALRAKPNTCVECGSGVSTVVLARCMQLNGRGHVYSLDHDPHFARKTREHLAYHGLAEWATVLDAPLRAYSLENARWQWYSKEAFPAALDIDLLVVDGPPMTTGPLARYPAGPLLFPRLSPTAAVFLDDAKRREEREVVERWKRSYSAVRFEERDCEKGCIVLIGPCDRTSDAVPA